VNSPQNARQWEASATRIFGLLSAIFGFGCAVLSLAVIQGSRTRQWGHDRPTIVALLGLLLSANLIYVGWHTIARGSVPIAPRPLFRWRHLVSARTAIASMNTSATVACVVALFVTWGALGAHVAIAYSTWVSEVYSRGLASNVNRLAFGEWIEHLLNVKWVISIAHFPAALIFSTGTGMLLGLIRRRPAVNVCAAIVLLLLGLIATFGLWLYLIRVMMATGLFVFWYAAYLPPLPIAILFLSLSQAALVRSPETLQEPQPRHWSSHFFRTILVVGIPAGLVLGITLGAFLGNYNWIIGGMEISCAALYGASLVYTDRRNSISLSDRAPTIT